MKIRIGYLEKNMDKKSLDTLVETYFITLIAKYGLKDAKKIVKLVSTKLKAESRKRKEKK